ncbi:enoyl-CoA hydratase/isomerase family protein [Amaricoccus solimangrovi]|uniref:3-hydroxyisobutyryl-CoA hydrolase n=1 Tax=Amaricoccus solimangrovi TaxID=2589815 RepID=A0A501WVL6_9RHOB|nr:enoyl-CoA hydratase/isomerase family protein [Amaricoccus solimangrovi]TPE53803.1 enoyl-CoA hydratase/isomerase family protein [Amaricoccus solimangrovi]
MSDVWTRKEGRAGRITLTRPKALNALSLSMALEIQAALDAWREDATVDLVLMDAEGARAFCAGGDIARIYHAGREGDFETGRRFFTEEYRMNAAIARYPKPIVALAQGFVLGGGVGLSGHARYRVLGESTRVAMPECPIGLVPDVGGSLLLARAPGRLGEFVGLSAHRMEPGDAILAGFFDRFVPEADWPALAAELVGSGDPGAIARFEKPAPEARLAARLETIDDAFSAPDLRTLAGRLEATDWGHEVLRRLRGSCPLSLACALELVRAARAEPGIEAALRREYRFTYRAASQGELLEGIRAAVIDKDRAPVWRDSIGSLRAEEVAAMLAPLGARELDLTAGGGAA